jgi:WD40 repeat protein
MSPRLCLAVVAFLFTHPVLIAQSLKDREGQPLPEGAIARLGSLSFRLSTIDQSHGGMAISHDGKRLAVYEFGKVHVWELETGKTLQQFDYAFYPGYVEPIAISPNGKQVMVFNNVSGIKCWDIESGKVVFEHEEVGRSSASMGIGFLIDGTPVYSRNSSDETGPFVGLHDAKTKKELKQFRGEKGHSFALDILPDGKTLMGGMFDRENDCVHIRLYDAKTFELKSSIDDVLKGEGCSVAGSCPDGSTLFIVSQQGEVSCWNAADGKQRCKIEEKPENVEHAVPGCLSWDGKIAVLSGCADNTVRIFDKTTGKLLQKLEGAGSPGGYACITKDGKRVVHRGRNRIHVWDVKTGKQLHLDQRIHPTMPVALSYLPDGKRLAAVAEEEIFLWNIAEGKVVRKWTTRAEKGDSNVSRLVASPDGKYLLTSGQNHLALWETETGKLVHRWEENSFYVAQFDPESKRIYLSTETTLDIWEIATQKRLESQAKDLLNTYEISVLPGGELVALNGLGGMGIHDAKTGKFLRKFTNDEENNTFGIFPLRSNDRLGVIRRRDFVWQVFDLKGVEPKDGETLTVSPTTLRSFTERSRMIALAMQLEDTPGGAQLFLTLVDKATGKIRYRRTTGFSDVESMSISPNGRYLATGNSDTTILIWDLWNLKDEFEKPSKIDQELLRNYWEEFGGQQHETTDGMMRVFVSKPDLATAFLTGQLQPVEKADAKVIATLIEQLESNRFPVREKAARDLARLGDVVVKELRRAQERAKDEDLKMRIESILNQIDSPFLTGDRLRAYRGIEILQRLNTAESKALLKKIAQGAPDAFLTREAQAALQESNILEMK